MNTKNTSLDKETARLFWRTTLAAPKSLLLWSCLFPLAPVLLNTLAPLYTGKLLASIGQAAGPNHYLLYFVIAGGLGFLCNRFGFVAFLKLQAHVMRTLQEQGLQTLLQHSMRFHNNNVGGKLVSDVIDLPAGYVQFSNAIVTSILPLSITLVSGSIVIFWESWQLGLVIVAMTTMAVGTGLYESVRRSGLRKQRLIVTKNLTGHLADTILNVQTVKTFAREQSELQLHQTHATELETMRRRDWGKAAVNGSNRIAALLVMQAIFVVLVLHLVKQDPALLGIGIFAFTFTISLSNRLFDINNMLRAFEDGLLLANPLVEIMQSTAEIQDKPGAKKLSITKGAIALRQVDFAYHEGSLEQNVFKNLELSIKPGEKIGLVGPSGGGKSTLTRLLLRFDDVTAGKITIDNQDISAITQASLRQAISYVPQEPLLFHRTVRENIAYGNPEVSLDHIQKAAKLAHAHDFIANLKDGYDTIVGERGVKLSGGQRQRIAIARAILKNAPILVLDEATSALDSESEQLIQAALQELMHKRTAIVIAHRLSTIQKMDRIIVLDNGAITEQGTHQQLLKCGGLYAKLWAHQSGGFIED